MLSHCETTITALLLALGLLLGPARASNAPAAAPAQLITRKQFAEMSVSDQFRVLRRRVLRDETASDEVICETLQRLLGGLLGTDESGCSCLMVVIYHLRVRKRRIARAAHLIQLLLTAARERGLLRDLLEITDEGNENVFNYVALHGKEALLRPLLRALDRLGPCAAGCEPCGVLRAALREGLSKDFPADIGDLIATFLPAPRACQLRYRLLNQQNLEDDPEYQYSPLLYAAENRSLAMVQLLVEAGADLEVRGGDYGTVLETARRHNASGHPYGHDTGVVAYLESVTGASR